jgi:hypothetical protein
MEIIDPLSQSLREDAPSVTCPMRQSLAKSQCIDPGSYGRNVIYDLGNSCRSVASKVDRDELGSAQVTLLAGKATGSGTGLQEDVFVTNSHTEYVIDTIRL